MPIAYNLGVILFHYVLPIFQWQHNPVTWLCWIENVLQGMIQ